MWHESDVPALLELALLRDRLMDGAASVANEVRLRENSFGLTPAGRQHRRWLIVDDSETSDELAKQRRKAERRKELSKKLH